MFRSLIDVQYQILENQRKIDWLKSVNDDLRKIICVDYDTQLQWRQHIGRCFYSPIEDAEDTFIAFMISDAPRLKNLDGEYQVPVIALYCPKRHPTQDFQNCNLKTDTITIDIDGLSSYTEI